MNQSEIYEIYKDFFESGAYKFAYLLNKRRDIDFKPQGQYNLDTLVGWQDDGDGKLHMRMKKMLKEEEEKTFATVFELMRGIEDVQLRMRALTSKSKNHPYATYPDIINGYYAEGKSLAATGVSKWETKNRALNKHISMMIENARPEICDFCKLGGGAGRNKKAYKSLRICS